MSDMDMFVHLLCTQGLMANNVRSVVRQIINHDLLTEVNGYLTNGSPLDVFMSRAIAIAGNNGYSVTDVIDLSMRYFLNYHQDEYTIVQYNTAVAFYPELIHLFDKIHEYNYKEVSL
jgi:hypothetical protein